MDKKMVKSIYILLVAIFMFSGCSTKSALSVFGGDTVYEKGLEDTKVDDIVNSFETKAILNATYLNILNPQKWDNKYQNFLVGIYIVDDNNDEENKYLNNKNYILTLNGKTTDKIEELNSLNPLWDHIPLKNPQAKYYIVSFKKDINNTLKLEYSHKIYGKITMTFQAN